MDANKGVEKMKNKLFIIVLCTVLIAVGLSFNRLYKNVQDILNQSKMGIGNRYLDKVKGYNPVGKAGLDQKMARLWIPFISNQGQVDKGIEFYAHTFGGTVFVTKDGQVFYSLPSYKGFNSQSTDGVILKEEIVGGRVMGINGEEKAITKVSYFKGNKPSKWREKIDTYNVVSLGEIYSGVELKLRAYGNSVEKLFYVKPGADVGEIRLKVNSLGVPLADGEALSVNKYGELGVKTELGIVKFTKPVAYQLIGEKKNPVEVAYVVKGNEYGFKVGGYDRANVLVIDPLLASTFLGGGILIERAPLQ